VRHEDDVRSLVDKTVARFGRLDVAVMSPYHFARRFQHSTGLPPHRFVVQQRIARARAFLATQEQSVAQISRLVGFRTPSHFTTVFRRVTGLTPGAYRTAALRADRPGREGG
jgi:AraC family transcriptional regulator